MKRILSLFLALMMLFSLSACAEEDVDLALDVLDMVVDSLPDEEDGAAVQPPEETLPDSQAPPVEETPQPSEPEAPVEPETPEEPDAPALP